MPSPKTWCAVITRPRPPGWWVVRTCPTGTNGAATSPCATASWWWRTADWRSSLTLATGGTFNRVEGLPVVFGPLFNWKLHRNLRLRIDALGVFRTAGDFTHKRSDLGYLLRTELRSGETPAYGIEFRAFDDVTPVEDWGLRAGEVGWAAFLFQRDYRDYYLSKGIAGRVFVQPDRSLRLDIDVRHDGQTTVQARDPWTVFRNDHAW